MDFKGILQLEYLYQFGKNYRNERDHVDLMNELIQSIFEIQWDQK